MREKGGWIRILEATVAVMIIAGVMLTAYSGSSVEVSEIEEYSESVQNEILSNLVLDDDLRLAVLAVDDDDLSDENFRVVNDYVEEEIEEGYGYSLRICDLDDDYDFCKMKSDVYVATIDRDVYVEEEVVAAEVGSGEGEEVYSPKKVKIYFWEGEVDSDTCISECDEGDSSLDCSSNNRYVVQGSCFNVDGCWVWAEESEPVEYCEDDEVCEKGECVENSGGAVILTCRKNEIVESGCVGKFDDECDEYDGGQETGSCGTFGTKDGYECWKYVEWLSECSVSPSCPSGYYEVGRVGCVVCDDECSENLFYCSGDVAMRKICGTGDDGCLEYGEGEVVESCDYGCSGGVCLEAGVGVVSMSFEDVEHVDDGEYHWYYHTRVFRESGGVGVSFTDGELCYSDGDCDDISAGFSVSANGEYDLTERYFYIGYAPEVFTVKYYGVDDNGNSVSVSESMSVNGNSFSVG